MGQARFTLVDWDNSIKRIYKYAVKHNEQPDRHVIQLPYHLRHTGVRTHKWRPAVKPAQFMLDKRANISFSLHLQNSACFTYKQGLAWAIKPQLQDQVKTRTEFPSSYHL